MSKTLYPDDDCPHPVYRRPVGGRPGRTERFMDVACVNPLCCSVRPVRVSDYFTNPESICSRCQQSSAGKLGYAATFEKYGRLKTMMVLAKRRIKNPSLSEQVAIDALSGAGLPFEREVMLPVGERIFLLDFVVANRVALEIDSEYWHSLEGRAERDNVKTLAWGGPFVRVPAEGITKGVVVRDVMLAIAMAESDIFRITYVDGVRNVFF